eukprot:TRINITY_DN12937_c0_g2_i1.p1 TRINITY_DN12937_c0_g2~~TRINITY_DN12937_c0_g2_i1.p1  ORF type:complete len:331 (-),score=51.04 TRINITY_DN12937_c0_g2_i1:402-1394(-)
MIQSLENESSTMVLTFDANQLIEPLSLLVQSRFTKTYQDVLAIFQSLAASNLLSLESKIKFTDLAEKMTEAGEMAIIKIIQILLIIITYDDIATSTLAEKTFAFSMHVFSSKSSIIRNNIIALLRQMYDLLFGQYNKKLEATEEEKSTELDDICYKQIELLISITGDKYKQINYKCLGMDILTLIFTDSSLRKCRRVTELIEKTYVPLLSEYLGNQVSAYQVLARAVKAATQVMLTFRTAYTLIQPMLVLTGSQYNWQRYLALEAFCVLFRDCEQLRYVNLMVNESTHTRVRVCVTVAACCCGQVGLNDDSEDVSKKHQRNQQPQPHTNK